MTKIKMLGIIFAMLALAYTLLGFSIFSAERSAIPVSDDVYLLHITSAVINDVKFRKSAPGSNTEKHAEKYFHEYAVAHQVLFSNKKINLVPRWYSTGLDCDDKFQRKSLLHRLYPWMTSRNPFFQRQ